MKKRDGKEKVAGDQQADSRAWLKHQHATLTSEANQGQRGWGVRGT